jgi:hypothetical protein
MSPNGELQRRQIPLDCQPVQRWVYAVVLMPQPISDAPNVVPRNARTKLLGMIAEPAGRFAQDQELSFHGSIRLLVCLEYGEIHTFDEPLD